MISSYYLQILKTTRDDATGNTASPTRSAKALMTLLRYLDHSFNKNRTQAPSCAEISTVSAPETR
ncbi:MAG: hypothetical protein CMN75_10015 [Spirochaeta sp.]|nr:hypothetical protein [Spirochaeta sp.]